ncbi:MAG: alanine racemase [bacterium]
MAELIIDTEKIIGNIEKLNDFLGGRGIEWSLVVKVLSGHKPTLEKILSHPSIKGVHSICDTRLSNLHTIKDISPDIVTMYIKPPAHDSVTTVVKNADISFNSAYETIEKLSEEAGKLGKTHRVLIMIEMGELREGILRENLVEFYKKTFELPNIHVNGIGTNLGCMYGVEPNYDKLIQLSLYKELLECKFGHEIALISGCSSITLPLVSRGKIPRLTNHFRIGEAAFFGTSPLNNKKFRNLSTTAFEYRANIIELERKETRPEGVISEASVGHTAALGGDSDESYKAILDFGLLDVDVDEIEPINPNVKFIGTSSDMTVYEVGRGSGRAATRKKYKVGGQIRFRPSYMAVARLINTKYVQKKVI